MPVDRPTFSESWYRVSELRPRLRPTVQIHRQYYRGRMWHVVQDPHSNQFYRLNDPAYRFVAMLDGRRSIAEVWQTCNEQFGDEAPTQGEAIQLLGQLYTSNLLQGDMPPDAQGLLKRYRKRRTREVRGYLMNLLFIRIPLFDPNNILNRWVNVFGKAFTLPGLIVWLAIMMMGLYAVINNWGPLIEQGRAQNILDPANLPLLYLSFVLIKACHEFAHGFACKKFGRKTGTGGDVHTIGIMLLVFTPVPYVDASSSWAFRSKWHRVVVGGAGILTELAIASIAAMVWWKTSPESPIHQVAYNMIFVASVSTVLFNGNPLLRYDGYYIFSDLLEIPNLSQRSKQYIYYLVKKYAYGVRKARNPAHTRGERGWFVFYGIASTIYRVFICVRILMFVAKMFFFVGALLALGAVVVWVIVPLGKWVHYLAMSPELLRVRPRAVGTTLGFVALLVVGLGVISVPEHHTIEGVVEPENLAFVHAGADGFLRTYQQSGRHVQAGSTVLFEAENRDLRAELDSLRTEREGFQARRRLARQEDDVTQVQIYTEAIRALDAKIRRVEKLLDGLKAVAPITGQWISPDIELARGAFVERGRRLGMVAALDDLFIRAVIKQDNAGVLLQELDRELLRRSQARRTGEELPELPSVRAVEIRVKGRPDDELSGRIREIRPAGHKELPSAALGYGAGGSIQTAQDDRKGLKATVPFFELHIVPGERTDAGEGEQRDPIRLLPGQRVVIRLELPAKPLAQQWYRSIRQLVQQRFKI